MAYDEQLAERVRAQLADQSAVAERKMFGGLAFMVQGHLCCGILGEELMVRVGQEQHLAALAQPDAREMAFTGRPMKRMVIVAAKGVATDDALGAWVRRGLAFVATLPARD
jgi:TfoX/Sxy family transcriptional regulator of competence genes